MEVVVIEEKKKIFRARKTMKISDRQQLDSLHGTLLTAGPGMSDTSPPPPPLVNGTHKEDGPKAGDGEQNTSDSNSPRATSPASPSPFLSLNLSPSPASSQSPKDKDDAPTSPTSPFHSLNFELKKMDDEEEEEDVMMMEEEVELKEKKVSPVSSSKESVTPAPSESKENQEQDSEGTPKMEKKEVNAQTFLGTCLSHTALYSVNVDRLRVQKILFSLING